MILIDEKVTSYISYVDAYQILLQENLMHAKSVYVQVPISYIFSRRVFIQHKNLKTVPAIGVIDFCKPPGINMTPYKVSQKTPKGRASRTILLNLVCQQYQKTKSKAYTFKPSFVWAPQGEVAISLKHGLWKTTLHDLHFKTLFSVIRGYIPKIIET